MKLKWVETRPGNFKLVDETDERPAVKLKSKIHTGTPNTQYSPPWKKYETPMFIGDPKAQLKAAEQFNAEREHSIKVDPKAAKWEKSRKEWFAKQKHNWRNNEIQKLREKGL